MPAGVRLVGCRQGWEELWRQGCWGPSLQAAQEPEGRQEGEHLEGWQSPTLRTWGLRVEGRVTPPGGLPHLIHPLFSARSSHPFPSPPTSTRTRLPP